MAIHVKSFLKEVSKVQVVTPLADLTFNNLQNVMAYFIEGGSARLSGDESPSDSGEEVVAAWLNYPYRYYQEIYGLSKYRAAQSVLVDLAFGQYFGLSSYTPNMVPDAYLIGGDFYVVPAGCGYSGDDSPNLGSSNEHVYICYNSVSGDPSYTINGLSILSVLQGLGYPVTSSTTKEAFREMVGEDGDQWIEIAKAIILGMEWDNIGEPDLSDFDCAGDGWVPGLYVNDIGSFVVYQIQPASSKGEVLFVSKSQEEEKYVVLQLDNIIPLGPNLTGKVLKYWKNSGTPEVSELFASTNPDESLWMDVACGDDTPVIESEDELMTPQEIWDNFPELRDFLYDDSPAPAPVGLSATKKHFIRVI